MTHRTDVRVFLADLVQCFSANGEYNSRTAPLSLAEIRQTAECLHRIEERGERRVLLSVVHDGDSSVGLPGHAATVELDDDYEGEERAEYITSAKTILGDAFSELWDGKARVYTEEEAADH
ncbi:TPA: hypothetical protein ACK3Q6_004470 [Burkholderia cepacia]